MIKLAIVSPCYNEEAVLKESSQKLSSLFESLEKKGKISKDSFILYVNDGSGDRTWQIITELHRDDNRICGLDLAHNVGHQNAIMAGMMTARHCSDAVVTIDADLQDDINAIEQMIDRYNEGADIVYGVKVSRQADSWAKRTSAQMFYRLLESMGVKTVYNHADFRFMSGQALDALAEFPERNLYLRGMIPMIGFKTATVDDVISERIAGNSKYTLRKMLALATNGITSFSTRPIEMIITAGVAMLFIAFCMLCYVVGSLLLGHYTNGWASLMLSVWFIGAALTISIGIVGTYIGKIYIEVKHRPLYIIKDSIGECGRQTEKNNGENHAKAAYE
ncbi:MAG: glycosyltransferase family 2 protein [Bacteroidales bacterium]|nr:glycosyltransferase family 2 protein [Bacteroidales bacterium]MCM1146520.1 glycosyltransferase family 2 protein [Bacteroidales bacterium]MCM1205912.1 glycosyltransferase family 2 protein [Bacillota bacterium]MCM1510210.1 glycosyltransferase family 2 protein [Clostridium sp.]